MSKMLSLEKKPKREPSRHPLEVEEIRAAHLGQNPVKEWQVERRF
jgi:hypothetical protein